MSRTLTDFSQLSRGMFRKSDPVVEVKPVPGEYRVRHGYHSRLPQVRQAKLGRTNSGRSYIVKKSTYD